jgi:alkylation response protein AidB-like acyl-CoA dehydrogenase
MNLDLTDDQIQVRDAVRELCETEFAPHAAHWDHEGEVARSALAKLAEHGFLGMSIPEEWGGLGYDARTVAIVIEEIARVSAALGIM